MQTLAAFTPPSLLFRPGMLRRARCRKRPRAAAATRMAATPAQPRQPSDDARTQQKDDTPSPPAGSVAFMALADEFAMPALTRRLLRQPGVRAIANGAVLSLRRHAHAPAGAAVSEAFVFPYGCVVVWGDERDRGEFVALVVEDAVELRPVPVMDCMDFEFGERAGLRRDVITLGASGSQSGGEGLEGSLERLAISCALAQSVKLGAFESALRATIENTRHLPEELAATGEITASRREVSRLMGQLFLDRYRYHLSGDLLMTPAFFWENEQYLPCYRRAERYLEVRERGEVLNKRVEIVQELYTLLGDELTHQSSNALELSITVMIAFEILLTLITIAKESMRSLFSAVALFLCLIMAVWLLLVVYRRYRRLFISVNSGAGLSPKQS